MNVQPLLNHIELDFLTQYLTASGIEDINKFLNPDNNCFDDPFDYPNMKEAVEATKNAVDNKKMIGLVCDADADGSYSASIAYQFLHQLNSELTITTFFHDGKQHGIHDLLDKIIESGVQFLIIPDAGSNSVDDCRELRDHGIQAIVLDHHEIEQDNPYAIVVNHHLGNGLNTALSGTGVTDKWVKAYCRTYGLPEPYFDDLVAMSIISDVCDVRTLENRAYLLSGLTVHGAKTNEFLDFLIDKQCRFRGLTQEGIAFGISPLCNALCRSPKLDKKDVFFAALNGDVEHEDALKALRSVKSYQDKAVGKVVEELNESIDLAHKAIFGFVNNDAAPFTGLVANKFCGKYNKPTLILRPINSTTYSGSLRSPFDIADKINESGLANCQGHLAACGIIVKKGKLRKLAKWFDNLPLDAQPPIPITAIMTPESTTVELCKICNDNNNKKMWGHGLETPSFYYSFELHSSDIQQVGRAGKTLKFNRGGMDFLKFFSSERDIELFTQTKYYKCEIICKLEASEWQGEWTPTGTIQEYEITELEEPTNELNWDDIFN